MPAKKGVSSLSGGGRHKLNTFAPTDSIPPINIYIVHRILLRPRGGNAPVTNSYCTGTYSPQYCRVHRLPFETIGTSAQNSSACNLGSPKSRLLQILGQERVSQITLTPHSPRLPTSQDQFAGKNIHAAPAPAPKCGRTVSVCTIYLLLVRTYYSSSAHLWHRPLKLENIHLQRLSSSTLLSVGN